MPMTVGFATNGVKVTPILHFALGASITPEQRSASVKLEEVTAAGGAIAPTVVATLPTLVTVTVFVLLEVLASTLPKLIEAGAALRFGVIEGVALGVGVGVVVAVAVAVGLALAVEVGVAVAVADMVGVGVRLALAVGLALAVEVGVVEAVGVAVGVGPPGTINLVTKASLSPSVRVVSNAPTVVGKSTE